MENIKSLRITAYAIVEMKTKKMVDVLGNWDSARELMQEYKTLYPSEEFKLLKLAPEKFVR